MHKTGTAVLALATATAMLLLLLSATGYAETRGNTTTTTALYEKVYGLYEVLVEIADQGGNVTNASLLLGKALECLQVGNATCAEAFLEKASKEARVALETVPGPADWALKTLAAITALATPLLLWQGLPRLQVSLWVRARRDWRTVDEKGRPVRLWDYARKRGAYTVYAEAKSGVLVVEDPSPPQDFLEYLASPAYSLWAWAVAGLAVLAALLVAAGSEWLTPLRLPLGLVAVFFLPGYALLEALYPRSEKLSQLEIMGLSIALSLAIVPLAGLLLSFTPWRVRPLPVAVTLTAITSILVLVASYRKYSLLARRRIMV